MTAIAGVIAIIAITGGSDAKPRQSSTRSGAVDDASGAIADVKGSKPNETRHALTTGQRSDAQAQVVSKAPRPRIVVKLIPYSAKRRAEMAAYALRHYGIDTWRLTRPRVIVEHYTASESFSSAYGTFASDSPDGELGELPGDCSHFIIDKDGTIYQLVPTTIMCRHTVGLNYTAIGIEHVGTSDQEILNDPRQLDASLALTAWLMQQKRIRLRNVIGHNESLTSPYHKELYPSWRCQTHGDWNRHDMDVYRAKLRLIAKRDGIPIGPSARRVIPNC